MATVHPLHAQMNQINSYVKKTTNLEESWMSRRMPNIFFLWNTGGRPLMDRHIYVVIEFTHQPANKIPKQVVRIILYPSVFACREIGSHAALRKITHALLVSIFSSHFLIKQRSRQYPCEVYILLPRVAHRLTTWKKPAKSAEASWNEFPENQTCISDSHVKHAKEAGVHLEGQDKLW